MSISAIESSHPSLPPLTWADVAPAVADFILAEQLPSAFINTAKDYYFPLALRIAQVYRAQTATDKRAQLVGINGAQGTGKSTLAALLKCMLERGAGLQCAILSIDDVYLTRTERYDLAQSIHPLLQTRGVPGTHDLSLALDVFSQLLDSGISQPAGLVSLPRFNKALDERRPPAQWYAQPTPVDVVLFEGWCVAARPQSEAELTAPINQLEADEDVHGIWRGYVNSCLASAYQTLFARLDYLIMIKAPSLASVLQWRWEQEQKLIAATLEQSHSQLMSRAQVERFIQHYERLTRHILEELPARADLVYHLNESHAVAFLSGPWAEAMNRVREENL